MAQSTHYNKGKQIGILRGASTHFATWFYVMMRFLRLKDPLLSTVHQVSDIICTAISDITDPKFFKVLYVHLGAVFPAIHALHYCNKGERCIDKIYYLTYHATEALNKSKELLNDEELVNFEEDVMLEPTAIEVPGTSNEEDNERVLELFYFVYIGFCF
jgi:hypothetical protein